MIAGVADAPHVGLAMLLAAARALGMLAVPWWPGMAAVPLPVRGGAAAAWGAALGPVCHLGTLPATVGPGFLLAALALNLAVGLALGYGVALLFAIAEMGGHVVELATGMAPQALFGLPAGGTGAGPLGTFATLVMLLVFVAAGGIEQWITALVRSTDVVPLAGPAPWPAGPGAVLRIGARALETSLGMAAPALGALLLVNLAVALSGRVTGQAALYFAALPAEALAVLGVLLLTAAASVAADLRLVHGASAILRDLLGAL